MENLPGRAPRHRRIFCNRTLNLRAIRAVGYDMDYTLIHYDIETFERHAYDHIRRRLERDGWHIGHLRFDPQAMIRGLFIDKELGNIVKPNRFGFVKVAYHGSRRLDYEAQHRAYERTIIDLSDRRFSLLNTFFTLSEGCLFSQLVDLFDAGKLKGPRSYTEIHDRVRAETDAAYMEGELKPAVLRDPSKFVEEDPDAARTLLDQKASGKKLMLITNSEWDYTEAMMSYAFDRNLPGKMRWRDLFDLVIVSADKPGFFTGRPKLYEIVDQRKSLLRPAVRGVRPGGVYCGGNARHVEEFLGLSGDEILYIGDHIIGDVQITKEILRWRTGLIMREIEEELVAQEGYESERRRLVDLMREKQEREFEFSQQRLLLLRAGKSRSASTLEAKRRMSALRKEMDLLEEKIGPLSRGFDSLHNRRWGLLMRTGSDKSFWSRIVEGHADVYTSRVSNLLHETPFLYLRSSFVTLPHD